MEHARHAQEHPALLLAVSSSVIGFLALAAYLPSLLAVWVLAGWGWWPSLGARLAHPWGIIVISVLGPGCGFLWLLVRRGRLS